MIGRNSPIEISRAIRAKQDARMMRDAIRDLDPFQTIFGIPCWRRPMKCKHEEYRTGGETAVCACEQFEPLTDYPELCACGHKKEEHRA